MSVCQEVAFVVGLPWGVELLRHRGFGVGFSTSLNTASIRRRKLGGEAVMTIFLIWSLGRGQGACLILQFQSLTTGPRLLCWSGAIPSGRCPTDSEPSGSFIDSPV